MIFPFKPISEPEYYLNRLNMLSSVSVAMIADLLQVPEPEVMKHPEFVTVAKKMIDEVTF